MPQKRPLPVLITLIAACISYSLSQTMVVPTLPVLVEHFHTTESAASWLLTGFLLSASIATPIAGKLGDLYGKGRVLTGVMTIFAIGAIVCGLAGTIGVLIAGRVLQGVAGGVFPLAFGVVRDTFPRHEIPGGMAIISAVFGIGGGIGLPLAGVIVAHLPLQWLFWVGLVAVPVAIAAHFLIPPSPPVENARVDWWGAGLLSASLALVLLGVSQAGRWGWGSPATLGMIIAGVAVAAVFVRVEGRVHQPLIDLEVLRKPAVAMTNLTGFMVGVGMYSAFLTTPAFAQAPKSTGYGFGFSVTASGLLLLPTALAQLFAGAPATRLALRYGFRTVLSLGALLITLAYVIFTLFHGSPWDFAVGGILLGAGITFAFSAMANLIVEAVPRGEVGIATGINTVMRTVGGAFGAAIVTAFLTASGSPPTEAAYTTAFAFAGCAGLAAILASRLVPPRPAVVLEPV